MALFRNFCFVIILGCVTTGAEGLKWLRRPVDAQAPVGGSAVFHCEVDDRLKTVIWTNGSGSALFANSHRIGGPQRYSVEGRYSLHIGRVETVDDGQFVCTVEDFATETVTLTVLLQPGPPAISQNFSGSSFTEGQVISFVCRSTGGNPNPTIYWLKNGQEIFDVQYSPSSSVGGTSSSRMTRVLNRSDHRANYTCVVFNTLNTDNKLTTSKILSVQYSPYITFRDYNPLYVMKGQNASITCQVDAHPAVTIVNWIKGGKTLLGGQLTRYFQPTVKSDSGVYTCQASNGIGGVKRANIEVNVVYAPVITVLPQVVTRELERVQVTCEVDASPEPFQVQWERADGNRSFVRQSRVLTFTTVGRTDAGNYTCKAWSQLTVSGQTPTTVMRQSFTQLLVEYQPGNGFIKPVVAYNKGDRVILRCEATPPGYPVADFEWRHGNSIRSETSGTLTIASAQLTDNGDYTCTPVNRVGRGGQSTITLTINEPPSMVENPPAEITQPLANTETLQLTCRVRGRPTPSVQWFKDNDTVSVTTLYPDFYSIEQIDETTDQYSSQIKSILTFRGPGRHAAGTGFSALRIEDIGNYTCAVISPAHTLTLRPRTQLYLQFAPRVSTGEDRVAVTINADALLPCLAHAYPAPDFQWYRNGLQLTAGQGHYLIQVTQLGPAQFRSDLTILEVKDTDLGEYKCFATNFLGNVSQPIGLTVKTVPEAPRNLRYASQTWDSVMLEWDKGFNGGYPQTFHVRYSVGEKITNISVIPSSASKFNVTNLTPHTSYLFMVFARNKRGESALSKGVMTRTDDLQIPAIDVRPRFDSDTRKLSLDLRVDAAYCVRITVMTRVSAPRWGVYEPCLPLNGQKVYPVLESSVQSMNVSVCLTYRHDVCGPPVQVIIANPSSPGLTERDVIIIASICAVIIVTLLVVLVCFICRRRRLAGKDYETEAAAQRPPPVNGTAPPAQKQSQTFDNPGMTRVDEIDLDVPGSGGVFTTSQHTNNNSSSYGPLDLKPPEYKRGRHMQVNGHVPAHVPAHAPHDTSYDSQLEKRMYENEMNRRNENVSKGDVYRPERQGDLHFHGGPRSPTKDKYIDLEEKNDIHLHGGHDTPEPSKPKKVVQGFSLSSLADVWTPKGEYFPRYKLETVTNDVYYSDLPTYSHDPPGHTCGLPCCRNDLDIHLQTPSHSRGLCIPAPHKQRNDNFSFGRSAVNRLAFSEKFRSLPHTSEEMKRKRLPIPLFKDDSVIGLQCPYSISTPELSATRNQQWKNVYHRPICLPDVSPHTGRVVFLGFLNGETDDSVDLNNLDETILAFYATSPKMPIEALLTSITIVKPVNSSLKGDVSKLKHSETVMIHNAEVTNSEKSLESKVCDDNVDDVSTDDEHYYDVLRSSNTDYENSYGKYSELYPTYKILQSEHFKTQFIRDIDTEFEMDVIDKQRDNTNTYDVMSPLHAHYITLDQLPDTELSPIYEPTQVLELPPLENVEKEMVKLPPIIEVENELENSSQSDSEESYGRKFNYVNTISRKKLPKSALASPKPSPKLISQTLPNFEGSSTFPQRHKKADVSKTAENKIPLHEIFPWGPSSCVIEILSCDACPASCLADDDSDCSENYYEDIEFYPYKSESSYFGKTPLYRTFGHKDVVTSKGELSERLKNSPITMIL